MTNTSDGGRIQCQSRQNSQYLKLVSYNTMTNLAKFHWKHLYASTIDFSRLQESFFVYEKTIQWGQMPHQALNGSALDRHPSRMTLLW